MSIMDITEQSDKSCKSRKYPSELLKKKQSFDLFSYRFNPAVSLPSSSDISNALTLLYIEDFNGDCTPKRFHYSLPLL